MENTIGNCIMGFTPHGCESADAVWGAIPDEKRAFYQAVDMVVQKANVFRAYEPDPNAMEDAQALSKGGYAELFVMAFKSFCGAFSMSEEDGVDVVQRVSDWFGAKGWTHCSLPFRTVYETALETYDAVRRLRAMKREAMAAAVAARAGRR